MFLVFYADVYTSSLCSVSLVQALNVIKVLYVPQVVCVLPFSVCCTISQGLLIIYVHHLTFDLSYRIMLHVWYTYHLCAAIEIVQQCVICSNST